MFLIVFLVILRISANSFSSVFQKKLSKNLSSLLINFLSYFLLAVFCVIFAKLLNFDLFDFKILSNNKLFYYTAIVGLLGAIGNSFQIKALEVGELSVIAPINAYKIIFGVIFSYFLLNEVLNLASFFGIILIFAGTFMLFQTSDKKENKTSFLRKDIFYRLSAVFFMALEAIFIKKLILVSNSFCALFFWAVSSSLFSLLFYCFKILPEFNFKKERFCFFDLCNFYKNIFSLNNLKYLFLLSFSIGLMQFSTNILFKMMNVASCLCLFQLSSILSVILGYKLFKEQNLFKKLIASSVMIIGAWIIILNSV